MLALVEIGTRVPVVAPIVKLPSFAQDQLRRATDGWHVVARIGTGQHRVWLRRKPLSTVSYAVLLPYDRDFKMRHDAADRLWRALRAQPLGPASDGLSEQRRTRLVLILRALDGWQQGNSYRTIAEVLFGAARIPARAWKTHDVRSLTRRLVKDGLSLVHGGYRKLLRPPRKDE
ncbi:DUF2285 domain-containing protein [Bradyrhizobium sp. HKCCYLS20291]|uniref:DUF2285 domain-containing protein n=1 Tax=Bradyrhizobium sp. HKCCYLS20291 TaxID=3420766 RepID=UPI003EB90C7F